MGTFGHNCIGYRMKIFRELNLAALLRVGKFIGWLNIISKVWLGVSIL